MPPKGKAKQIEPTHRRLRSEGTLVGVHSEASSDSSEAFQQIIQAARRASAAEECQAAHSAIDNINTSLAASEEALEELTNSSIEWETLTAELSKLDSQSLKGQVGKVKALTNEYEAKSRSNSLENIAAMDFTKNLPAASPSREILTTPPRMNKRERREEKEEGAGTAMLDTFLQAEELAKTMISPEKVDYLTK